MLQKGVVVTFFYPAANYANARKRLERRRVRVDRIRDFLEEPLDESTTERNPFLVRSGCLVYGFDLDKLADRAFYSGSMEDLHVCEADSSHSVVWIDAADWLPTGEEPIQFELLGVFGEKLSRVTAEILADGGNAFLQKAGDSRRLLTVDYQFPKVA